MLLERRERVGEGRRRRVSREKLVVLLRQLVVGRWRRRVLRRDEEFPSAGARPAAAPVPGRGGGPGSGHGVDCGGLGARPQLWRGVMVVVVQRKRSSRVKCSSVAVVSHWLLAEHLLHHVPAHSVRIVEERVVLVCLVDLRRRENG